MLLVKKLSVVALCCILSIPQALCSNISFIARICSPAPAIQDIEIVCIGVYFTERWVVASLSCLPYVSTETKVVMGSGQMDCESGIKASIAEWSSQRSGSFNVLMIQTAKIFPLSEDISIIHLVKKPVSRGVCFSYCGFKKSTRIMGSCNELIPFETTLYKCKRQDLHVVCANTTLPMYEFLVINSPVVCEGMLAGFTFMSMAENMVKTKLAVKLLGADDANAKENQTKHSSPALRSSIGFQERTDLVLAVVCILAFLIHNK